MTTTSERIRSLARLGNSVSDIAKELGIKYQHAYKVCRDAGISTARNRSPAASKAVTMKPALTVEALLGGGFVEAGYWTADEAGLLCPGNLPKVGGVYAFSIEGVVMYVGVASNSLAKRLYFYGRPGRSQATNIRLNALMSAELASNRVILVHCAEPPEHRWNGFVISGPEGLEAGLIRGYDLPWNRRGS